MPGTALVLWLLFCLSQEAVDGRKPHKPRPKLPGSAQGVPPVTIERSGAALVEAQLQGACSGRLLRWLSTKH